MSLVSPPVARSLRHQPHVTWQHQVTVLWQDNPVEMSGGTHYYSLTLKAKWLLGKNESWDIVSLSKKGQCNCLGVSTPPPTHGQYFINTQMTVFSKQVPDTSFCVSWSPIKFKPPTPLLWLHLETVSLQVWFKDRREILLEQSRA